MAVYLWTMVAVGIFSAIASAQFKKQKLAHPDITPTKHNRNLTTYYIFVFICAAILVCVAGLRHNVGTDYGGYYWRYPQWSEWMEQRVKSWDEPGLAILARLMHYISDDGAYFIFAHKTIQVAV